MRPVIPFRRLALSLAAASVLSAPTTRVHAFEVDVFGTPVKFGNLFTIGALMRMQDRDITLIGKGNLNPGLCVSRVGDDGVSGPGPRGTNEFRGTTCNPQEQINGRNANDVFVEAPGSFSPNGDNGNLNFEKYDIVHATAKLTTDISFSVFDANVFIRTLVLFDNQYNDLVETRPDTTGQPARVPFSRDGKDTIARQLRVLDGFISRNFEIGDRFVSVKLGRQVLNWGESGFLLANSLNAINPPDQALLRLPGFDIRELQRPLGMISFNSELIPNLNAEAFYGFEWQPVTVDPVGSFFSQSDTLGPGGTYAMLSFGKAPEDPGMPYTPTGPDDPYQFPIRGVYRPADNPDDPAFILNSQASRTLQRDLAEERRREPKGTGQYGLALRYFAENFNGGTEFGFYFANYHARVPSVSGFAAAATCLPDSVNGGLIGALPVLAASCDFNPAEALAALASPNPQIPFQREALPVDTPRLFVEYPENIRMYGVSFNTTVGDWAFSGEYAFRDNLPIQVHTTDLVFALLQPAFPANDLDLTIAVLPGRRSAVPDFIQTNFRGVETLPGQYVRGWEPMKIGQLNLALLRLLGAAQNPFGASQMTLLLETGFTHLPGFPSLAEFQANGAEINTHISAGADGSRGINPRDVRSDPNDPFSDARDNPLTFQNPTSYFGIDPKAFPRDHSYGYRFVTLTRYDNAIFGANIELLNAFFHDVKGVGAGLGQNFVEGRKQILSGIRWEYQNTFVGELRYTWFTGGGRRDALRDRDNLLLFLGYQF